MSSRRPRDSIDRSCWDVIVVGAGPGGLSAALLLARACRSVLVIDDDQPRNQVTEAIHGFLTRDGTPPEELRRLGRAELARYPTAELRRGRAVDVVRIEAGFELTLEGGGRERARRLVLATGVKDLLPDIPGLRELYGKSVFHCPHCDGWELRDRPLAAYGCNDDHGPALALQLRIWSDDVIFCTGGSAQISDDWRARLARHSVAVRDTPIERLIGRDGRLEAILFADGERLARDAFFFSVGRRESSDLAERLGCSGHAAEGLDTDPRGRCGVPGVHVVGDASRDVLLAIVAAGEGAMAAVTINAELCAEENP
jgi:thioredoxin reductase